MTRTHVWWLWYDMMGIVSFLSIYLSIHFHTYAYNKHANESQMKQPHTYDINNINISEAAAVAAIESFCVYLYIWSLATLWFSIKFPISKTPSHPLFPPTPNNKEVKKKVSKFPSLLRMKFQLSPLWHIRNIQWAIISTLMENVVATTSTKEQVEKKREREV